MGVTWSREEKLFREKILTKLSAKQREGLELGISALKNIDPKQCEIKPYAVALHLRVLESHQQIKMQNPIKTLWEEISSKYDLEAHQFDGGLELRPKGRTK